MTAVMPPTHSSPPGHHLGALAPGPLMSGPPSDPPPDVLLALLSRNKALEGESLFHNLFYVFVRGKLYAESEIICVYIIQLN